MLNDSPVSILVALTGGIADHLLALPLLGSLRRTYPAARILLVADERGAWMHRRQPWVSSLMTFDSRRAIHEPDYREAVLGVIQRERWDLALLPQEAPDLMGLFCMLASAAPRRWGILGCLERLKEVEAAHLRPALTDAIPWGVVPRSEGSLLAELGAAVGLEPLAPVAPPEGDGLFAQRLLDTRGLQGRRLGALVAAPGDDFEALQGLLDGMARTGGDAAILVIGARGKALSMPGFPAADLRGGLAPAQMLGLLHCCDLLVGTEQGLRGWGPALCRPSLVLARNSETFWRHALEIPESQVVVPSLSLLRQAWESRPSEATLGPFPANERLDQALLAAWRGEPGRLYGMRVPDEPNFSPLAGRPVAEFLLPEGAPAGAPSLRDVPELRIAWEHPQSPFWDASFRDRMKNLARESGRPLALVSSAPPPFLEDLGSMARWLSLDAAKTSDALPVLSLGGDLDSSLSERIHYRPLAVPDLAPETGDGTWIFTERSLAVNLGLSPKGPRFQQIPIQGGEKELISCPFCGLERTRPVRQDGVVRCDACGLVFLKRRPNIAHMERLYSDLYGGRVEDAAPAVTLPPSAAAVDEMPFFLSGQRQNFVEAALHHHGGDARELAYVDVGCGWGGTLHHARRLGMRVLGYEFNRDNVAFARETLGLDVRREQFHEAEIRAETIDILLMSHVLEHMPFPVETMEQIHRVLRPGGIFFCVVPNFASLCSRWQGEGWSWLERGVHYTHFTPGTLARFFREAGFIVESWSTHAGDYGSETPMAVVSRLHPTCPEAQLPQRLAEYESFGLGEELRMIGRKR